MKKKRSSTSMKMFHEAPPRLFGYAKENRYQPTVAEALLWDSLKNKQLSGYKFRRQHPVGYYIVDFYCLQKRLVIEIDGGYHFTPKQQIYDAHRTAEINLMGISVIRFTNQEVMNDLPRVLEKIMEKMKESA